MKLKQYFHVSDRESEPVRGEPTYDRLYKVCPIIDHVSDSFLVHYEIGREVSIGEAMVKFTRNCLSVSTCQRSLATDKLTTLY